MSETSIRKTSILTKNNNRSSSNQRGPLWVVDTGEVHGEVTLHPPTSHTPSRRRETGVIGKRKPKC